MRERMYNFKCLAQQVLCIITIRWLKIFMIKMFHHRAVVSNQNLRCAKLNLLGEP